MSESEGQPPRRRFLRAAGALAGAAAAAAPRRARCANAAEVGPSRGRGAPLTVSTPSSLVVATTCGRVRGYVSDGISTFKGIPYGDGRERFMPARVPVSWAGIRTCFSYGPICPQPVSSPTGPINDLANFYAQGEPGRADEDCLRVNVWTPSLAPARRPVIVWIHGGGFESGSSHESVAYHGESLSRRGDVVVVSLNHRLNALGFLNLAAYGSQYATSANVGMLDIVLALEWVRDNIEHFGGSADNVTLMGQSGGGRKVTTLLAMPAAKNLFHKAIIHSGSLLTVGLPVETAPVADATLEVLGLKDGQLDRLQSVPVMLLIDAFKSAQKRLITPRSTVFEPPYCTPTLDGVVIPVQPFERNAPQISSHVPLLVGSTLNEVSPSRYAPELEEMNEAELEANVALDYGDRSQETIAVFRHDFPFAKPIDIYSMIQSLPPRRTAAVRQAQLKAVESAAVYNFQFAWHTPVLDRRPRAHHGSDLPFVFNNIDRCVNATGGGAEARVLATKMCDAWVNFARTGDPNHAGLPRWPRVTPGTLPTMIFDVESGVRNDHDREERRVATVIPESLRHL